MVRFIAHCMASPRNPHYGHIDDAREMLRHLKTIASVTPDVRKLKIYGYLDEEN